MMEGNIGDGESSARAYKSKRLWIALGQTIQRHEGTYGSVELDVTRRAHPTAFGQGGVGRQ